MIIYPQEFPAGEIQLLYHILTGQRSREAQEVAKLIWIVQGYIQSFVLGDPDSDQPQPGGVRFRPGVKFETMLDDRQGLAVMATLIHPAALVTAGLPDPESALAAYAKEPKPDAPADVDEKDVSEPDMRMATLRGRAMLLDTLAPVLLPLLQRWLVMLLEGGLEYLIRQIQSQADPQMEQPMPTPMQARRIQ